MSFLTNSSSNDEYPTVPAVTRNDTHPYLASEIVEDYFEKEETGDATMLYQLYKGRLAYDSREKKWYLWDGHKWIPDASGELLWVISNSLPSQYEQLIQALREDLVDADDMTRKSLDSKLTAYNRRVKALRSLAKPKAVRELAQSLFEFTGDWDSQPYLLAVKNGVVDLEKGELHIGQPADYLRMTAPTEWKGLDCPAPRFEQFMLEICNSNKETVRFLQCLLGYGLLGKVTEHIFPIFYGAGRNGKDTLLEMVKYVLGNYAGPIRDEILVAADSPYSSGGPSPHIMTLKGKRLVWASESSKQAKLNEKSIKRYTGGGELLGRNLYENDQSFQPTHLMLLMTNHKPIIEVLDYALKQRIVLVPFELSFVKNPTLPFERQRDDFLKDKLKDEASGILAWLVRGYLMYQREGLNIPSHLRLSTEGYLEQGDDIQGFIREYFPDNPDSGIPASDLYEEYCQWAEINGVNPVNNTAFGRRLSALGYEKKRTKAGYQYTGLGSVSL